MKTKIILSLLIFLISIKGFSTVWTVTNSGTTFTPASITINLGDSVNFNISGSHNALEVSQTTWNANGNTALSGGFQTPYAGGLVLPAQLSIGTHYYVCVPHASMGMKGTITVQNCSVPVQPGIISGNTTVCAASSNLYSIVAVAGASSYTWTLPVGWTGSSTSNSITVIAGTTNGTISVTANNSCGSSVVRTLSVTSNTAPAQPGVISGNVIACATTSNLYSIVAVAGASSYTWTLPVGWTGSSTTNSMTAIAGTTNGTISVTANNSCGSSVVRTLSVTSNTLPAQPGIISGNISACATTSNLYSIVAVAGASSYTWTLPVGWTGSSTTNSMTSIAGTTSGTISVTANNSCGSSVVRTLNVTSNTVPAQPGIISGNSTVCNASSNTYSVVAVAGASSYTWTLPLGWTASSTTNSITAIAGTSNGNITVKANNSCGSSALQTLNLTINTVDTAVAVSGMTLTANAAGANYQWINCNGNIPVLGQMNQSFTAVSSGSYAVIVSKNGCTDTSFCHNISIVGIQENITSSSFRVFPNPSNGKFTIETGNIENGRIEIYNLIGAEFYQSAISGQTTEIDISNQPKGIYFIKIYSGQSGLTKKIIVQ